MYAVLSATLQQPRPMNAYEIYTRAFSLRLNVAELTVWLKEQKKNLEQNNSLFIISFHVNYNGYLYKTARMTVIEFSDPAFPLNFSC